ncbi:hypothetical protein V6C39_09955 [Dickeya ananatis]
MPRPRCLTGLPSLGVLDRTAGAVGIQLTQALRRAIQRGELKAGERIPINPDIGANAGAGTRNGGGRLRPTGSRGISGCAQRFRHLGFFRI